MTHAKNRRKSLIIDKDFQYRYLLMAVSVIIIVVNVFLIVSLFVLGKPLPGGPPWLEILSLAAMEVLILLALTYFGIRESHAIAGPLFVLNRSFQRIRENDLSFSVTFRKVDQFHHAAIELTETIRFLRLRLTEARALARKLDAGIEPDLPLKDDAARLRALLEEFALDEKREKPEG